LVERPSISGGPAVRLDVPHPGAGRRLHRVRPAAASAGRWSGLSPS